MKRFEELSYKLAIMLADVALSEVVDETFEDPTKLKYSRVRLPIALRFIDTRKFKVTKRIAERQYDVGYVGRFEKEKGLHDLVIAIQKLHEGGVNPAVLIVGGGSLFHFTMEALRGFKNVKVMSYVPHSKLPEIYNEIKILVLPSRKEGIPTVLLESLACGVIPIVSSVGGMPWLIRKSGVGIVLDHPDPNSILNALITILSYNPEEFERLSQKASRFVREHFSLERAIERYRIVRMI